MRLFLESGEGGGQGREGIQWGRGAAAQRRCEERGGTSLFDMIAPVCQGDVLLPLVAG